MRQYEMIFIVKSTLEEEALEGVVTRVQELLEKNGAEVTKLDKWGKRRLAYEINHMNEGYYVLVKFNGQAEVVAEVDRVLKISDDIIRHIIVREDN